MFSGIRRPRLVGAVRHEFLSASRRAGRSIEGCTCEASDAIAARRASEARDTIAAAVNTTRAGDRSATNTTESTRTARATVIARRCAAMDQVVSSADGERARAGTEHRHGGTRLSPAAATCAAASTGAASRSGVTTLTLRERIAAIAADATGSTGATGTALAPSIRGDRRSA